jgi:hypothetical protein
MAKARVKFPLSGITGVVHGADRTIGIDPGLASSFAKNTTMSKNDTRMGYNTKIITQTKNTRGGSVARHDRAGVYCDCDVAYRNLGAEKQSYTQPWWRAVMDDPNGQMSGYHAFMKCCLKYMAETSAFSRFSYVSRYRIANKTGVDWINKQVMFRSIPTYQIDGQDIEVYQLLKLTTKKGNITYDPLMIDFRMTHEVTTRGTALVTIPALKTYDSMLADVYSYYKP